LRQPANEPSIPTALVREFLEREKAKLEAFTKGGGSEDASSSRARCRTS